MVSSHTSLVRCHGQVIIHWHKNICQYLIPTTDRLRELNSRDDGVSSEHVQSSITWRPDIVQVKFIQDDEQPSPVGLRLNRQSSSVNLYVKDSFQMTAEPPPSSLSLIERICAIDELGYDEDCQEDTDQSVAVDVKTEFFPQSNQFKLKPAISDLTIISPVMEEITKEGDDESDTTSEISEIPDDELDEKSNCDSGPKNVPCEESESNGNDSDDEYSQDEEEYSENSSSEESYNSSFPESESASCSKVTRDDRHDSRAKQECSPLDVSLGQELRLTPNEDIKTTEWRSGNEANFDKVDTNQSEDSVGSPDQRLTNHSAANSRDIREEIKVEFERQHGKYFQHHHHRDIAKKSPEDSGFESYQQSSVEQNSNQNSDDDDVIATFSTVMEAENETSTVNEEHFVSNSEVYTTNKLFVEAEEARVRSRRLREESIKQLGLNFSVAPTLTTKNCDKLSPKPKTRESCGNQSTTKVLSECSKVGPKYLQQSIGSTKVNQSF